MKVFWSDCANECLRRAMCRGRRRAPRVLHSSSETSASPLPSVGWLNMRGKLGATSAALHRTRKSQQPRYDTHHRTTQFTTAVRRSSSLVTLSSRPTEYQSHDTAQSQHNPGDTSWGSHFSAGILPSHKGDTSWGSHFSAGILPSHKGDTSWGSHFSAGILPSHKAPHYITGINCWQDKNRAQKRKTIATFQESSPTLRLRSIEALHARQDRPTKSI